MSSWPIEKNIYSNMLLEEKRKYYKTKSYVTLDSIPTWDKQIVLLPPLERDVNILNKFNFKINNELNRKLAKKISVWKGDITMLEVDVIINAANSELQGGGGVNGAIHKAAGPFLLAECNDIKGCPEGDVRMSGGYLLPAKYVFHAVGPTDKSHEKLSKCYEYCFILQRMWELNSIAFPCIGTGIYNFPNVDAAHIACREARKFLEDDVLNNGNKVTRIIFCIFDLNDEEIYNSVAQLYFPLE